MTILKRFLSKAAQRAVGLKANRVLLPMVAVYCVTNQTAFATTFRGYSKSRSVNLQSAIQSRIIMTRARWALLGSRE